MLGPDLVVTGHIRDTGQNVFQCSFETESSSSSPTYDIYFFTAFLEEVFTRNMIIILWINYTIITVICINDNAAVIVKDSKTLFCTSKIPTGTRKDFFEICLQFGHVPSKTFSRPTLWRSKSEERLAKACGSTSRTTSSVIARVLWSEKHYFRTFTHSGDCFESETWKMKQLRNICDSQSSVSTSVDGYIYPYCRISVTNTVATRWSKL